MTRCLNALVDAPARIEHVFFHVWESPLLDSLMKGLFASEGLEEFGRREVSFLPSEMICWLMRGRIVDSNREERAALMLAEMEESNFSWMIILMRFCNISVTNSCWSCVKDLISALLAAYVCSFLCSFLCSLSEFVNLVLVAVMLVLSVERVVVKGSGRSWTEVVSLWREDFKNPGLMLSSKHRVRYLLGW